MTLKYQYSEDSYTEWVDESISADTITAEIKSMCENGSYGDEGGWVNAGYHVYEDNNSTDEEEYTYIAYYPVPVWIVPNHDALIAAAGGNSECEHEWSSEGEGGCDENPGVFGIGGAAISIREHCVKCGLRRCSITGDTNPINAGNRDKVEYAAPDENFVPSDEA